MKNPFVYGEIVPLEAFADRVVELDRLVTDLASGQKVFLISPRRYGKSSLVRHALARAGAQAKSLTLELTVSSFSSYVAFLEGYARALRRARDEGRARALAGCSELFTGVAAGSAATSRSRAAARSARASSFPTARTHARRRAARRRSVRAAGAHRRAAAAAAS